MFKIFALYAKPLIEKIIGQLKAMGMQLNLTQVDNF